MYLRYFAFSVMAIPSVSLAWEEEVLLDYITSNNNIIRANSDVVNEYRVKKSWTDRLKDHTTIVARVGLGGTDFRDELVTTFGGIQVSIPLTTESERKELSLKRLEQAGRSSKVEGNIISQMEKLRGLEATQLSAKIRYGYWTDRLQYTEKRKDKQLSTMDDMWEVGNKLNAAKAQLKSSVIKVKSQRFRLSKLSGEKWKDVLGYLKGVNEL